MFSNLLNSLEYIRWTYFLSCDCIIEEFIDHLSRFFHDALKNIAVKVKLGVLFVNCPLDRLKFIALNTRILHCIDETEQDSILALFGCTRVKYCDEITLSVFVELFDENIFI